MKRYYKSVMIEAFTSAFTSLTHRLFEIFEKEDWWMDSWKKFLNTL